MTSPTDKPITSAKKRSPPESLAPQRALWALTNGKLEELSLIQVVPQRVGWKAYGLACLPIDWASPFLVIMADFIGSLSADASQTLLREALTIVGLSGEAPLIVRSSGVNETLSQRGGLPSSACAPANVLASILSMQNEIRPDHPGPVNWVVQEHHQCRAMGHFSNERRVSYEKRDWVLEVEPIAGHAGYSSSVAIRQWRDGISYSKNQLKCHTAATISVCLKRVAMWAHMYNHRTHFEWVWDGARVFLVQADREEKNAGLDPRSLIPALPPIPPSNALQAFRTATPTDFANYRKLANAQTYEGLGFRMPPFYILDDPETMSALLSGTIPEDLHADLSLLTTRPLIIRTDGRTIPIHQKEMLPRSDELRSGMAAADWLLNTFSAAISTNRLAEAGLALIAHHFIPSVASAWSRGEPDRPIVRIESIWGLPEGLYWFAHDTYEVDTQLATFVASSAPPKGVSFDYLKRLRYKGSFIAPDDDGKWVAHKTRPPADWASTIPSAEWLTTMAWTTRLIAAREGRSVSVMWLLNNSRQATTEPILPWYHTDSLLDDTPTAAPRRKYRRSVEFLIAKRQDWIALRDAVLAGRQCERVVVDPIDPSLVREPLFARELGELAVAHNFVVELSGGVLSHAYYILRRSGARVECVDLFGGEEEVTEFEKLVRDKVSDVIIQKGERAQTVQLTGDALILALKQKLVEESIEALDALSGEELIGELADVLEVIKGIASALDVETRVIESERKQKRRKRGGFTNGTMLIRTGTPGSIQRPADAQRAATVELNIEMGPQATISDPEKLPHRPSYRRPDQRRLEDATIEHFLTIETDINRLTELKESMDFALADRSLGDRRFLLTLELRRVRGTLRAVVRSRTLDTQLRLTLDESQNAPKSES